MYSRDISFSPPPLPPTHQRKTNLTRYKEKKLIERLFVNILYNNFLTAKFIICRVEGARDEEAEMRKLTNIQNTAGSKLITVKKKTLNTGSSPKLLVFHSSNNTSEGEKTVLKRVDRYEGSHAQKLIYA